MDAAQASNSKKIIVEIAALCIALYAIVGTINGLYTLVDNQTNKKLPNHTLAITTEGKTEAMPDLAIVNFQIVQNSEPLVSTPKMSERLKAAQGLAKTAGAEDAGVTINPSTNSFSVVFDNAPSKMDNIKTFIDEVTKQDSKIEDTTRLTFTNVCMTFENLPKVQQTAMTDALSRARSKADNIAAATNHTVGKIINIADNSYSGSYFSANGYYNCTNGYLPGTTLTPQYVGASVNITYELK